MGVLQGGGREPEPCQRGAGAKPEGWAPERGQEKKQAQPDHGTSLYSPCRDVLRFLGSRGLSQHHLEGQRESQPYPQRPGWREPGSTGHLPVPSGPRCPHQLSEGIGLGDRGIHSHHPLELGPESALWGSLSLCHNKSAVNCFVYCTQDSVRKGDLAAKTRVAEPPWTRQGLRPFLT